MAASSIGTLAAFLKLDTSQWTGGFASAKKALSGFGSGVLSSITGKLSGFGGQMIAAAGATAAAGLTFNGVFESLDKVGHLASVAKKLGITVEETQRLGFAASKTGIDIDTMATGLLLMGKNIGSGGKGLDKRFGDVADQFVKIKDAGKRAEFARSVFGRGGFEFINLLAKGSSGIRQSADAIDRFGLAIKDVDAAKAKEAMLALKELKEVLGGLKDKLVVELSPAMARFFKEQLDHIESLMNAWKRLKDFSQFASSSSVGKGVTQVADFLGKGESEFQKMFGFKIPSAANPLVGLLRMFQTPEGKKPGEAGALAKAAATGNIGGLTGKQFANPLERGSVAAASAITNAGGNHLASIEASGKATVDKLTLVERHLAAATRKTAGTSLRPSNLRGSAR